LVHEIIRLILDQEHMCLKRNMAYSTQTHSHGIIDTHTHEIMGNSTQAQSLAKVFISFKAKYFKQRFLSWSTKVRCYSILRLLWPFYFLLALAHPLTPSACSFSQRFDASVLDKSAPAPHHLRLPPRVILECNLHPPPHPRLSPR
jgi:hypothetical protein